MQVERTGGKSIKLAGLSKVYGREKVVDSFTADVKAGEFLSLLGPSGSGKTTTLMMIAGFVPTDAGSIEVEGQDVAHVLPQHRGFGMVFQNYAIFPHLNVFENIAFPLRARGMKQAEVQERVEWAISMVRLNGLGERFSRQLSGGQQQRVAIARAIVFHPPVVLMDEPLGALDKNLRAEMQSEIREIQQRLGMTVIYVTHDQEEALTMSDRVAIMRGGKLEQIGAPREVYERPNNAFVANFLGTANLIEGHWKARTADYTPFETENGVFQATEHSCGSVPGRGTLFVRPEKLSIAAKAQAPFLNQATNTVEAIVRKITFLGNRISFLTEAPSLGRLTVEAPNTEGFSDFTLGDRIMVSWRAADSYILPA